MALSFDSLDNLRAHVGDCHRCSLGDTRTTLVFGVGDPRADVLFIGEAPGRNEDLKGEPFVGAAGQLLDELLSSAGMRRQEVYIANILKCRPPGNRDPLAEEIETCTPFLREQVRLIHPRVIVTLGNYATKFVLKTDTGITRLRGTL
ncbi:MAG: uracil-DNA glycosylase, partial [Coriobacteriia bacterium]|nr:uracil-DNA glycosylase [Coriobacteriia bacterium]